MGRNGFGARLWWARDQARLTQAVLARRAGIDRTWLAKLESGGHEPRASDAVQLHTALARDIPGLSLVWLLAGVGRRLEEAVDRRQFVRRAAAIVPATLALPMIADLERLSAPTPLDETLLESWEALTGVYARLRAAEPPRDLLPKLDLHLRTLYARMLDQAGPQPLRRRLGTLIAGTDALCAWVALTAERRQEARTYLDFGEQLAREIDDRESLALLLMLRADLLSAVPTGGQEGFPVQARRQLDEALALTSPTTPVSLRVPLVLRAAEEAAYMQDEREALRLLDQGANEAEAGRVLIHPLRPVWTGWAAPSFAGSAYQLLGRPREAIETLKSIDSRIPNHRPLLTADLAAAHAQEGNLDEASRLLADAIDWSLAHGHASAGRRIAGVRRRHLARWDDEPVVRELDERLAAIP